MRQLKNENGTLSRTGRRIVASGVGAALGAGLLVAVAAAPVSADEPVIDLVTQANIAYNGSDSSTQTGFSVAGAGDVNSDGFDDVVVGAPSAAPNGSNSGSTYVIFGSEAPTTPEDLTTLAPPQGFRIDGAATSDKSGRTVSGAGDVNGDGYDDLIIGALGVGSGSTSNAGASYVVFGSASPANLNLGSPGSGWGFRISGAARSDKSGTSVSGAGDFNDDGYDDVIVGAPEADANGGNSGAAYVIFGAAAPGNVSLVSMTSTVGIKLSGAAAADASGESVSGVGDVNDDGFSDVIVGAPGADKNTRADSGSGYVVFGSATPASIGFASPPVGWGFEIDGAAAGDTLGSAVSGAGDVNGDAIDDLIVGAPAAQPNNANSGSSYVIFGSVNPTSPLDLASMTTAQGFRLDGVGGSKSGRTVAGVGDLNGDGLGDVAVGAPLTANNGSVSGSSYVVFGSSEIAAPIVLGSLTFGEGFRVDGASGTQSGFYVAGAGDVNGDGKPDVLTGAPAGTVTAAYVVYGPPTQTRDAAAIGGQLQADVSWVAPVNSGSTALTGYHVHVATDQNGPFSDAAGSCAPSATGTSLATTCTATGLIAGQTYYFKVAAMNTVAQGALSAVSAGVTPTPVPDPTPTPDVVLAQTVSPRCELPARVKFKGQTQLLARHCDTNAGQAVRIGATGRQIGKRASRGDMRLFTLVRKSSGRVLIRTYGVPRLQIKVKATAKPVGDYKKYTDTVTYRPRGR